MSSWMLKHETDMTLFFYRLIGYLTLLGVEWPKFIKTGFSTKYRN